MGSEGREEQTLVSDQDNGIVYQDLEKEQDQKSAAEYFRKLAEMVCERSQYCRIQIL